VTTFNYTITKFDEVNKFLTISLENGRWTNIALKVPLPKTKDDLDKIICQYELPQEVLDARSDTTTDLSFITNLVNQSQTADRLVLTKQININTPPSPSPDLTQAQSDLRKLQYQSIVGDSLVKFGILTENPITQSMLDEANQKVASVGG